MANTNKSARIAAAKTDPVNARGNPARTEASSMKKSAIPLPRTAHSPSKTAGREEYAGEIQTRRYNKTSQQASSTIATSERNSPPLFFAWEGRCRNISAPSAASAAPAAVHNNR